MLSSDRYQQKRQLLPVRKKCCASSAYLGFCCSNSWLCKSCSTSRNLFTFAVGQADPALQNFNRQSEPPILLGIRGYSSHWAAMSTPNDRERFPSYQDSLSIHCHELLLLRLALTSATLTSSQPTFMVLTNPDLKVRCTDLRASGYTSTLLSNEGCLWLSLRLSYVICIHGFPGFNCPLANFTVYHLAIFSH